MKFEKLLEKYHKLRVEVEELRARRSNREEEITNLCNQHAKFRERVNAAMRLLDPQPVPKELDQVNQASAPRQVVVGFDTEGPRMGSPVGNFSDCVACPNCGHPVKR